MIFCFGAKSQGGAWVWVNGDSLNSTGVYGTQGVASASNVPPGLNFGAQWKDKEGNFWIFGGIDSAENPCNDLWKYDPVSNMWTWVNGPGIPWQAGVYGTQGVPSVSNIPGCRVLDGSTWVDSAGDFWMFGGFGGGSVAEDGVLNDLWRYHISTNEWTWMSGPTTAWDTIGNYGILQQPTDSNMPPARYEGIATWMDNSNNIWLFGGYNYAGDFNDMWRYNISGGEWTWMSGIAYPNYSGHYGTRGVENGSNLPPARSCNSSWVVNNYFYLWAGYNILSQYHYDDVWKYNVTNNRWTWIAGDSSNNNLGRYVALCSDSPGQGPMARCDNATVQLAGCGATLMTFGGSSEFGGNNDIWSFNPETLEWKWIAGDEIANWTDNYGIKGVPDVNNEPLGRYGMFVWVDKSNNIWMTGGQGNNFGHHKPNAMWEFIPDPTCFPIGSGAIAINAHYDTLTASGGTAYQWLLNNIPITGANSSTYIASVSGKYTLQATDSNGCITSISKSVTVTGFSEELLANSIGIFPNPTSTGWQLNVSDALIGSMAEVFEATGRRVHKAAIENQQSFINLGNVASGVYLLQISGQGYTFVKKLIKL